MNKKGEKEKIPKSYVIITKLIYEYLVHYETS
jgi:hypothetical protein